MAAKLIIVDDEKTTRESLTTFIPWSELSVDSVRAARNGVEALSLAAADPPDLLITDVRMPKMDGLALAARIRELYPSCRIIFLSGYADKEYLKKAIALRAVGYIEKPIDPVEVADVARSALAEIAGARSTGDVVRALIRPAAAGGPAGSAADGLPSFAADCTFTAAALLLRWDRGRAFADRETARSRILAAGRSLSATDQPATYIGFAETDILAVVAVGKLVESSPKARSLFSALAQQVAGLDAPGFRWILGVGEPVASVGEIPRSYETAVRCAGLAFYRGFETVLYPSPSRAGTYSLRTDDVSRLREALRDGDGESAALLVHRLAEEARAEEPADIDSVRNAFFDLSAAVFDTARSTRGLTLPGDPERTYVWQEIHERGSLDELRDLVCGNIRSLFPPPQETRVRESRAVMEIQRFIRENYAEHGLSLQVIADHARLSRTYVSFLFKSVTGENVNDYITRLRIARARELLLDPALRTSEAAARVGYAESSYFSTIFRKHVGVSPSEYRTRATTAPAPAGRPDPKTP